MKIEGRFLPCTRTNVDSATLFIHGLLRDHLPAEEAQHTQDSVQEKTLSLPEVVEMIVDIRREQSLCHGETGKEKRGREGAFRGGRLLHPLCNMILKVPGNLARNGQVTFLIQFGLPSALVVSKFPDRQPFLPANILA